MASGWIGRGALLLAAAVMLTACVVTPEMRKPMLAPIISATTADPDELERLANKGNAEQQYAWSLALRYGLNGVPADLTSAITWRAMATRQTGTTTIPIYIAGTEGRPGYTIMSRMPTYAYAPGTANVVDECVAVLASRVGRSPPPAAQQDLCGGPAAYAELQTLWNRAARR